MISTLLAQAGWKSPTIDYHALAPEIVLAGVVCVLLIVDLFVSEARKWILAPLAGFGVLAAIIPIVTQAVDDFASRDAVIVNGGGFYVVDNFALVIKAIFLLSAYVVILLSQRYVEDGDYYQGEYYFLLLTSVLGMVMMASSRDLVSIFVALEFLSIPAYMLAAWRKRDVKSNEAGVKYFLLGVFASAVLLYGMSLLYGETGDTRLTKIAEVLKNDGFNAIGVLAIVFTIVGFAFKVSAVPFHTWAPDTYEGAPTPVTAFLSVASKAAGFVGLVTILYQGLPYAGDVWQPMIGVLAAVTMTVGNVLALRQKNIVRMLAYSSVSQGGFILMPLAVAGMGGDSPGKALTSVVTYLAVYAVTNLGMFATVIAVSRKTRSGEISSWGGLFSYAPGLAVLATVFLASLAGIPPLGGWIGKFTAFQAVLSAGTTWSTVLAVIGAVNAAVAFGYYGNLMREMWMKPQPDGDHTPITAPGSLRAALFITAVGTFVLGILPGIITRFGELSDLAGKP